MLTNTLALSNHINTRRNRYQSNKNIDSGVAINVIAISITRKRVTVTVAKYYNNIQ